MSLEMVCLLIMIFTYVAFVIFYILECNKLIEAAKAREAAKVAKLSRQATTSSVSSKLGQCVCVCVRACVRACVCVWSVSHDCVQMLCLSVVLMLLSCCMIVTGVF